MVNPITLELNGLVLPDDWIRDPWGDIPYPFGGISLARVKSEYERALAELEGDPDGLVMFINSDGGVIEEGLAVYDWSLSLGIPVATIGIGAVYSMGGVLLMAGETRMLAPHAKLMLHLPAFDPMIGGITGNKFDIQAALDLLIADEVRTIKIYSDKTGIDEATIAAMLADGQDHYFTATEALAAGYITGIYQQQAQLAAASARQTHKPVMARLADGKAPFKLPKLTPKPAQAQAKPEETTPKQKSVSMSVITSTVKSAMSLLERLIEGKPLNVLNVTTADGKEIEIDNAGDTYAVNDTVKFTDDSDLPNGDYVLSDGNTITVVDKVITVITEPTADEEGETVTISKEEFDRLKALDTTVAALNNTVTTVQKEQAAGKKAMGTLLEALKQIESANPVAVKPTETGVDRRTPGEEDTPLKRQRAIAQAKKEAEEAGKK